MTITDPEIVPDVKESNDEWDMVCLVCCVTDGKPLDQLKSLCGAKFDSQGPPKGKHSHCVECIRLSNQDYCPVFGRCTEISMTHN